MARSCSFAALVVACLMAVGCGEDGGSPDGAVTDGGVSNDASVTPDADSGQTCEGHHDCAQGEYCHRGSCRRDELPVYHCGKPNCPPGRWCVQTDGARSTCAEDDAYVCDSPCACGPGFCCVSNRCVRDEADPWLTNGTAPVTACRVGPGVAPEDRTPTYCATDPECFVGAAAWASSPRRGTFLAFDPASGAATPVCGGRSCFGTACNCDLGASCVETVDSYVPPGATCGRLSGGSCVSHALAEAVFDWAPTDLLDCCAIDCLPGERCEAGAATRGNRYGYERVIATCAAEGACTCGDGACCPGEIESCPRDCVDTIGTCGDGSCDRFEHHGRCPADCIEGCGDGRCADAETPAGCPTDCADSCPDGWCSAVEAIGGTCPSDCENRCSDADAYNRAYRVCGDGVCSQGAVCDWDEPESCATCATDCGPCEWEVVHRAPVAASLSASEVFAGLASGPHDELISVWGVEVTTPLYARAGADWLPVDLGATAPVIGAMWSDGAVTVAVGQTDFRNVAFVRVDGHWVPMDVPSATGGAEWLRAVWGSGLPDIYAASGSFPPDDRLYHYDGSRWTEVLDVALPVIAGGWAAGPDDLYVAGSHCDAGCAAGSPWGAVWRREASGWTEVATVDASLRAIWGSDANDVFAVGTGGTALHFDGSSWTVTPTGTTAELADVWGSGPSDVYAMGNGVVLHYDGSRWSSVDVGVPIPTDATVEGWIDGGGPEHVLLLLRAIDTTGVVTGLIFRRYDGTAWSDAITPSASMNLLDVTGLDETETYVAGTRVTALGALRRVGRFDGRRITWIDPSLGIDVTDLDVAPSGRLYGAGYDPRGGPPRGGLLSYEGGSWSLEHTTGGLARVAALSDNEIYVGSETTPAERFDGSTWTAMAIAPGLLYPSAMTVNASGALVVAGRDRLSFPTYTVAYVDGGVSTVLGAGLDVPNNVEITSVWGSSVSDVYTVQYCDNCWSGPNFWFLHYDGAARTDYRPPTRGAHFAVGGTGPEDVVLVGAGSEGETYLEVSDGSGWRRAAVDLRQAGSYGCPALRHVSRVGGSLTVVGDDETILRRVRELPAP